jgi:DNA-directed RNA polymerase II subunit RPB1
MVIAMTQTIPDCCTDLNMQTLQSRVRVGSEELMGASTVIKRNGMTLKLGVCDEARRKQVAAELVVGDVVERFLADGDIVAFNRQPSLHKESIMAHRVKIDNGLTFKLNVCVTSPYNADFDGDEMNMHTAQSLEAMAELREILCVSNQLVSPQSNKPIIGLVQDSVIGSHLMTCRETFLERHRVMDLSLHCLYKTKAAIPRPAIHCRDPHTGEWKAYWTGKQVYSLIIPPINVTKMVRDTDEFDPMDQDEGCVIIRHGELLCGSLCKGTVGRSSGGIVHVTCNDIDNEHARRFLSDAQRLTCEFMYVSKIM